MQSTQLLALLAGLASAAPAAVEPRQFQAQLQFNGAAATYTISAPTDATLFYTGKAPSSLFLSETNMDEPQGNSLAVDQICSEGGATCSFHGVDGALVTVVGAHCVTVGPPQAIDSGSCLAL